MQNKLPPELHIVQGTKGVNQGVLIPESLRKRIPPAEWLDNPQAWSKQKFILETSDFLYLTYGIGNDQDKHTITMLADQMDLYIQCNKGIAEQGIISEYNDGKTVGPNPHVAIREKTLAKIILLMNELGLTPRSRLSTGKAEENSSVAKFLRGPKG
jgi:P27 family predicted phage terminase small subunit